MTASLERAKTRLQETACTCVLRRGEQEFIGTRRGIAPLLDFLDSGRDMTGFCAADRVVGKAAAFLYVRLGVAAVYAPVMSRPAYHTLTAFGIAASYGTLTDAIVNRAGDGGCPMEQAVWDITDPIEAEQALRRRLAELTNHKM